MAKCHTYETLIAQHQLIEKDLRRKLETKQEMKSPARNSSARANIQSRANAGQKSPAKSNFSRKTERWNPSTLTKEN